ncbi:MULTISPECIES: dihydrolipoamide acetyltransferase family protein [Roseivirga]|jgi:2-oxoglutarate dehydrogenase E2 component (dihydrolipoamide succinyltransferase)|uniref:Dihydrolipoamide acetyltransferase component of pyruvate dehydrogenase complex n=1 Tax=Roseivirga thermotolerans TaxID=1758176 RepID=A0ABQ3I5T8_9BACT|nr:MULTISPECIES: dihydrolipoamide acetyltransferase family protein [Roseivirga]MEC7753165.1 dihydrolipoamide acetyltransferase family protein [Bacteroidota bacterium]GHE59108.1 dihydrolipoamide acetyltransferase component of pyruvate dehydrogenase complex [Roseivirga thermotolerans]|tara:strand:+ start:4836 stop:6158 length:1323 start_codon:yes stop_codon:yes gene_type:complete
MAIVEMVMPKMGESIMEGTVLTWLKKEGDTIEPDESVLEVATDKVDTEVPATHGGILKEILVKEGDVVAVGAPIAKIETDAAVETESQPTTAPAATASAPQPQAEAQPAAVSASSNGQSSNGQTSSDRFYSPLVMSIARQENISMAELESVPGTGREGRVTKKDILAYVKNRPAAGQATSSPAPAAQPAAAPARTPQPMPVSISGEDEIIEMDRMRKMIAERMVDSKRISPHVTSFVEADVTNIVYWRNRVKQQFKEREGEPITFTPIFIEAVVKAIKDYPMMNVQVDGTRIIKKKDINIGMAVALPTGNLIVPVIHNADQLSLVGITKKVNQLAKKARENKLSPDDLQGGTYTVSNVGSFGNVMGTPIIMQPQVGILALGAVVKKPAVIETPNGDAIAIRHKMFLSHSYDHRVVDGSLGGMFVRRVADYLEKFDLNRGL